MITQPNPTSGPPGGNVERLPIAERSSQITDELNRLMALLRELAPAGSTVSVDFDGKLHAHIHVRKREDVMMLERQLSVMDHGRFHSISVGNTPNRPFHHRVSALVEA